MLVFCCIIWPSVCSYCDWQKKVLTLGLSQYLGEQGNLFFVSAPPPPYPPTHPLKIPLCSPSSIFTTSVWLRRLINTHFDSNLISPNGKRKVPFVRDLVPQCKTNLIQSFIWNKLKRFICTIQNSNHQTALFLTCHYYHSDAFWWALMNFDESHLSFWWILMEFLNFVTLRLLAEPRYVGIWAAVCPS